MALRLLAGPAGDGRGEAAWAGVGRAGPRSRRDSCAGGGGGDFTVARSSHEGDDSTALKKEKDALAGRRRASRAQRAACGTIQRSIRTSDDVLERGITESRSAGWRERSRGYTRAHEDGEAGRPRGGLHGNADPHHKHEDSRSSSEGFAKSDTHLRIGPRIIGVRIGGVVRVTQEVMLRGASQSDREQQREAGGGHTFVAQVAVEPPRQAASEERWGPQTNKPPSFDLGTCLLPCCAQRASKLQSITIATTP
jgi:hypothetical protein